MSGYYILMVSVVSLLGGILDFLVARTGEIKPNMRRPGVIINILFVLVGLIALFLWLNYSPVYRDPVFVIGYIMMGIFGVLIFAREKNTVSSTTGMYIWAIAKVLIGISFIVRYWFPFFNY